MDSDTSLGIVIPLFNEGKNVEILAERFLASTLWQKGLIKVYLVNNASEDNTGFLVDRLVQEHRDRFEVIHLKKNLNYGGGVLTGLRQARESYLGYLPGDNQIAVDDVERVWQQGLEKIRLGRTKCVFKGNRVVRLDGMSTRSTSALYTIGANFLLGLGVRDINGLPKIFHRSLLNCLPEECLKTFTFDAQLLTYAKHNGWEICEWPVTFHARRAGVSSWSKKRIQVYKQTFKDIWYIRNSTSKP